MKISVMHGSLNYLSRIVIDVFGTKFSLAVFRDKETRPVQSCFFRKSSANE